MVVSTGTDPGMLASEMNPIIAIIANRPLFNSLFRFKSIVWSLTPLKSIGGKTMVGRSPPFM